MSERSELDRVRAELADLRAEVQALRAERTQTAPPDGEAVMSRRRLLLGAGGAAAAGLGAAVLGEVATARPAAAINDGPSSFTSSTTSAPLSAVSQGVGTNGGPAVIATIESSTNASSTINVRNAGMGRGLHVDNSNGTSTELGAEVRTRGTNSALKAWVDHGDGTDGVNNASPAVQVIHNGRGQGLTATLISATNAAAAVTATTAGTGRALEASSSNAAGSSPALHATTQGAGAAVEAVAGKGHAVLARSTSATNTSAALRSTTNGTGSAILGESSVAAAGVEPAIKAVSTGSASALHGHVTSSGGGHAVHGLAAGQGSALRAEITNAANSASAVFSETNGVGPAISASKTNPTNSAPAVNATTAGTGSALEALINNTGNSTYAVRSFTHGTGGALWTRNTSSSNTSPSIEAETFGRGSAVRAFSGFGIGVEASGGLAPLRLNPSSSPAPGPPLGGDHQLGEIMVDAQGGLFQCKASGTPGEWLRVGYNPVDPFRIVDTRPNSAPDPSGEQALGPGAELLVDITALGAIPDSATAVTLNVTAVAPTGGGFLSLYPANLSYSGANPPSFSNVNFRAGSPPTANQATIKIAPPGTANAGRIKVFNAFGETHVVLDIAGFFS